MKLSKLAGAKLPKNKIDGRDVAVLFKNPYHRLATKPFFYYAQNGLLEGVRLDALKLIKRGDNFHLYNLDEDFGEEFDLAIAYPKDVEKLKNKMKDFEEQLNAEKREVGHVKPSVASRLL